VAKRKRGKKSEIDSEQLRHVVLNIARQHFARHGFQGANLKDIASDAGVAGSLINYHFVNKQGLLQACLEPFAKGRMEAISRILNEPASKDEFRVRIRLFADEMLEAHLSDPFSFEIVDREVKASNPVIFKIFSETLLIAFKAVVSFFAQAQKKGLLRKEVDPLIAAALLFSCSCDAVRKDVLAKKFFGVSFQQAEWRKKFSENIMNLFSDGVLK
jgi:AcrR family transcriptional regulator